MTFHRGRLLPLALAALLLSGIAPVALSGRTKTAPAARPEETIVPPSRRVADAEAMGLLGRLLAEQAANDEEALSWLEKAVAAAPADRDASAALVEVKTRRERKAALVLAESGDPARAEMALRAFHDRFPGDRELAFALARILSRALRHEEALSLLEPLLAANPDDVGLLTETADAELALGRFGRTRRLYEKALELVPAEERDRWQERWASRLQAMGDFQRAVGLLRGLSEAEPGRASLKCALAWALASCERYEEADGLYRDLLASEPRNIDALQGLSAVNLLAKDFATALDWADRLAAVEGTHLQGRADKAAALSGLGRFREARPLIAELAAEQGLGESIRRQILRLVSRGRLRRHSLETEDSSLFEAILDGMAGSKPGALEKNFWENVDRPGFAAGLLSRSDLTPSELLAFGDLFSEVGSFSEAIAVYRIAWERDPDLLLAGLNLCRLYGATRRFTDAEPLLEALEKAYPDHYKVRLFKARMLSWDRRFRESLGEYANLRIGDPSDPVPAKEMARVCFWAQWPASGTRYYQDFLEPPVDRVLCKDLEPLAKRDAWIAKRLPDWSRASGDGPFRIYEMVRNAFLRDRDGFGAETQRDLEKALRQHLPRSRIQKYFFLERRAKERVRSGHLRSALPVFDELLRFAPGNQEARFDQSQALCALGLTNREKETYRRLLAIDPQHNLVQRAARKLHTDRQPRVWAEYDSHHERGRGLLSDMRIDGWRIWGDLEVAPRTRLAVAENVWSFSPGIWNGRFRATGPSLTLTGVFNEWSRGQAGFTRREFDRHDHQPAVKPRDRDSFFLNGTISIGDRFDLGIGFDRSDLIVNDVGLRDGIQADTRRFTLHVPFSRKFYAHGRFADLGYSDGNNAFERSLEAGYSLTGYPEIFRVILSTEFRHTERESRYLYRDGVLENIVHPYWTPRNHRGRGLTLQYWRDFSRLRIARADHSWLDLRYTVGDDSIPNRSGRWDLACHWEFDDRWSCELRGSLHDSRDWDAQDFGLMLGRRF